MDRYNKITKKFPREIVLLKAYPCKWGRCRFCDYIEDNSMHEQEIFRVNQEVLSHVTGEFGVLEVIDSASCFELPKSSLDLIKEVIHKKDIKKLFLESHWIYRHRLQEMREFFEIPILFKIGVETFDNDFRERILNKNANFQTPQQVAKYFDSPCIMVGMQGQTKEMIRKDITFARRYFSHATINVYTNNTTCIKRDENLIKWFQEEFKSLDQNPYIEVLWQNTDFGVGD